MAVKIVGQKVAGVAAMSALYKRTFDALLRRGRKWATASAWVHPGGLL